MKETKHCKPCNTNLPLEDFGPHPGTKDRRQIYCRVCQAERAASMRDQHHELDAIRNSAKYLERHEARRAEEAAHHTEEAPVETERLVPHEPVDLGRFFREPRGRCKGWSAA